MFTRDYCKNIPFRDDNKFPYGISRSGDFTIDECRFLEEEGGVYKALFENLLLDANESDLRMLKVFRGELSAESFEERTWLKYLNYKKRTPIWLDDTHTPIKSSLREELEEDEFDDDDIDVDLDDMEDLE